MFLRRTSPKPPVRLSVNLSDEAAINIAHMAARQGISVTELVRRSVGIEMWRQNVEEKGGAILVESSAGDIHVVTWPYKTPHAKPAHCTMC